MYTWVWWWGCITLGLCGLSWLLGRRSRPHPPTGIGPWETSRAVYFSPNGGALDAMLQRIRGAKKTILAQGHLLHSRRLAGALVRAHQRGVHVQVMLDAHAQRFDPPGLAVEHLMVAGIAVWLDDHHDGWAHDKIMVLDEEIVITGSYNWTVAAEKDNSENLLVIHDPHLAQLYTSHWQHHAQHSFRHRYPLPWPRRLYHWCTSLRRARKPLHGGTVRHG